jgi:hypothetical protein
VFFLSSCWDFFNRINILSAFDYVRRCEQHICLTSKNMQVSSSLNGFYSIFSFFTYTKRARDSTIWLVKLPLLLLSKGYKNSAVVFMIAFFPCYLCLCLSTCSYFVSAKKTIDIVHNNSQKSLLRELLLLASSFDEEDIV